MFKQDWMERQIEAVAQSFAAVLFGKNKLLTMLKEREEEQTQDSSTYLEEEMIKRVIKKYVDEKKFLDAENMIFKLIETSNSATNLEVAICFYNELNDLDDQTLEQNGFSREKIKEGIEKLKQFYAD